MYPISPVTDASAAATPARYEPCSSANTSDETFGSATDESSTIANWIFGYSVATFLSGPA